MAVMPGVDYRPIGYSGVPRMTRYDVVCVHTIVGNDPAPAAHFSVRSDGHITQSRDTFYQSAANYQGNYRCIAIETDDHDANTPADNPFPDWGGSDVPALTDAQCEAVARIAAWAYQTHGVPLVGCPDSKATSRGVGYHRLGIDGNWAGYAYGGRVSGGEHWSTSTGKVCPGDRRIKQVIEVITPRARVIAGLDEDMSVDDIEAMMWKGGGVAGSVAEDTLIARVHDLEKMIWAGGPVLGSVYPGSLIGEVRTMKTTVEGLVEQVAEIRSLLTDLAGPGVTFVPTGEITVKAESGEQR